MRVLFCPDKFKGTLTAPQAAEAMAGGWREARPADEVDLLPISDGGDGFGELLGRYHGAEERWVETVDAAHRPIRACWWWVPQRRMAFVESARVIGLAMLPPGRFHPFELDTFGLWAVLEDVRRHRPRLSVVGLGGSATNEAGFGLARAKGWRFLDKAGREIERWPELVRLDRLVGFSLPRFRGRLCIAVDVTNCLLGRCGATRVYGPQKGIRPEDIRPAEQAFRRLIDVLERQNTILAGKAYQAGAGAAGGLGFGLSAFVGGPLESGFEFFARVVKLGAHILDADLVVTGEGAIDRTTLSMGKGVGGVARNCRQLRRPCIALGGMVTETERSRKYFTEVHALAPDLVPVEEARREAARWLKELAYRVATAWSSRSRG